MKSYSQAGQDTWVVETMHGKRNGTFLEIGAAHPVELSNTYLLERDYGWTGLSVDKDASLAPLWKDEGRRLVTVIDALNLNFDFAPNYDYLSLDIDASQLAFVRAFSWSRIRFKCMTVEHDSYRFGDACRDEIRAALRAAGYKIDRADVTCNGLPFEDWWVVDTPS